MKLKSLISTFIATLLMISCDDSTSTLGHSVIPNVDDIIIDTLSYNATSKSILANDSILSGTSTVYLGRFTDAETGTMFESSFIAQFNCVEDYGFPEQGIVGDTATSIDITLFFNSYFGDSVNAMKLDVYPLTTTLKEDTTYYTNLDPKDFYDSSIAPIAQKTYAVNDYTLTDSALYDDDHTPQVSIELPKSLGDMFIQKYYETDDQGNQIGKVYYSNSEEFIENICKGYYFNCSQGDGTVLYIVLARINVHFNYYVESQSGELDSLIAGTAQFSSTQEVLQVNSFNNGDLEPLVDDNSATYLKTPAGIFTEVELPVDEMTASNDTLNSVKLTFTRYNEFSTGQFAYGIPQTLLLLRKHNMNSFFEKNGTYDNITSYYTSFDSNYNQYEFSNIARLISVCAMEKEKGMTLNPNWVNENPDWNKVVLIPVVTTTDSNGSIVGFTHDLSMNSIRLKGGQDKIKINVVSSRFTNE